MFTNPLATDLLHGAKAGIGFGAFAVPFFTWVGFVEAASESKRWVFVVTCMAALFMLVGLSKSNFVGMLGFVGVVVGASLVGVMFGAMLHSYLQSKRNNGGLS